MIAFDNGPANGDYVRYIDDLMARAAVSASAATLSRNDDSRGNVRERTVPAPKVADGYARESTATTGFVAPTESGKATAAAAAIASALMSGEMGKRVALNLHQKIGFGAIAGGVVLVLAGMLWQPFSIVPIVIGAALVAWALRMMRDARLRLGG